MSFDTGQQYMSDVDIVNAALVNVGSMPIGAMSDDSDSARAASILYLKNRNMLFRKIPWNFARKWVNLAQLPAAPLLLDIISPPDRGSGNVVYTGAFQLPIDCLRVYRFSPKDSNWRIIGKTIYTDAIPANYNAGALLGVQPPNANGSNIPSATTQTGTPMGIEYVARIIDPTQWDMMFTEALVAKMTLDLCFGQTGLSQVRQDAAKEYQEALTEAASVNGMENWPDQLFDTTLVDVRVGYTNVNIDA